MLHQTTLTTNNFYTRHPFTRNLLHQTPFYTRHVLHQTTFTTNNFYTTHPLHQKPFTPDTFLHQTCYTRQLLQQTTFTPGTLYTRNLLHQTPFYTRHVLHQTTFTTNNFYTRHPLHQKPFTPDIFYTQLLPEMFYTTHTHTHTHTRQQHTFTTVFNNSASESAQRCPFYHSFETIVRPSPPQNVHFTTVLNVRHARNAERVARRREKFAFYLDDPPCVHPQHLHSIQQGHSRFVQVHERTFASTFHPKRKNEHQLWSTERT